LNYDKHRIIIITTLAIGIFLTIIIKDAQTDIYIGITMSVLIGLTWIHYMIRKQKDK
jgi:hypothetical protein